jgi:Tfp pilus assembly protein PilE
MMEEKQVYQKSWQQNAIDTFLHFFPAAQAVSFFAAAITKEIGGSSLYLLLSLLSFWPLLLEYKVHNIFLFFLAHLPLAALVFLSRTWSVQALCGIYALGLIGYSFHLRYANRTENTNDPISLLVITLLLFAIMYMAAPTAGISSYRSLLLTSCIFFCILYVAFVHAVKVDAMLFYQNQQRMDQPVAKIRRTNRIMVVGFLIAMVIVFELLLCIPWDANTGSGVLLAGAFAVFERLLAWFALLFSGTTSEDSFTVEESVTDQDPTAVYGGDPSWIWVFLQKVLVVAMVLLVVAVLVYAVYRIYHDFYRKKRVQRQQAIVEGDTEDTEEFIPKTKKRRLARISLSLRMTNEERVRKLFYKKINKKMDHQIRRSDTPEQIDEKLPEEELSELIFWYDRARYSKESIRDEELKKISERHH